ncbi:MAG: MFS transporter [Pontimonas sp.]
MTTTERPLQTKQARKVAVASFVGTALESYDQYVYAWLAALFVGPLFFEPLGPVGGVLASFATFAVTFFVRPLGAIYFGHLGDRIGRRSTLIITITLMGVATGLIGVLPTYEQAGWIGAGAIVVLRLAQGISLGGEWGGAVALTTEHAAPEHRGFFASLVQLGSPVGSILSNVVWLAIFLLVPYENIVTDGWWRLPLLSAFPLLLIALYLRWSIDETPVFKSILERDARVRYPFLEVIKRAPFALVIAIGGALLGHGSYTLMNTYTTNYGVEVLGYQPMEFTMALTIGSVLQLITIPTFGWLANRVGSAKVVAWGALGTMLVSFPLYWIILDAQFLTLVLIMVIGGILPTASWAALGGMMSDIFDEKARYTALAVSYNVGASVAATLPFLLVLMREATNNAWWHPGVVLAALSLITLLAAAQAGRMRISEPRS